MRRRHTCEKGIKGNSIGVVVLARSSSCDSGVDCLSDSIEGQLVSHVSALEVWDHASDGRRDDTSKEAEHVHDINGALIHILVFVAV